MTTLELIERGIGHNCLSDAYDLGRADQKKADNEFFNHDGAWQLEMKKIRADAIEECISLLEKYHIRGDLIKDLEQLKEQKNDNSIT